MPTTLTAVDRQPDTPDTTGLTWWDEFFPPWCRPVTDYPVDGPRTAGLARWEVFRDGNPLPVRVTGNTPLQRAGTALTRTWEAKNRQSVLWNPFSWARLPLQQKVWLSTNNDHTWFAIDQAAGKYYEASAMGPMFWSGYWRADSIRVFDLKRDWRTQQGSISASRIPTWALTPSIEALNRGAGGVQRALPFVAAGYGGPGQWLDPSRGTDGYIVGHPIWNGSRLRFTRAAYERLLAEATNAQDEAIAWTGRHYGFLNVDKTSEDAGHALRLPKSPRLQITSRFWLTDLKLLAA